MCFEALQGLGQEEGRHVIPLGGWLIDIVQAGEAVACLEAIEGRENPLSPISINLEFRRPPQNEEALDLSRSQQQMSPQLGEI